ncbi:hypothetical protein Tco_1348076, partial [Tanacetum coccineum]
VTNVYPGASSCKGIGVSYDGDPTSKDIPQQIEYLWSLESLITASHAIAVIVILLESPLEHLEGYGYDLYRTSDMQFQVIHQHLGTLVETNMREVIFEATIFGQRIVYVNPGERKTEQQAVKNDTRNQKDDPKSSTCSKDNNSDSQKRGNR